MIEAALILAALVAIGYQIAATAASLKHLGKKASEAKYAPGVSVLKPVRGLDEGFAEAIRDHAQQSYREFEILFGVHTLEDPAVGEIRKLIASHPGVAIRLVECRTEFPNGKVGVLADLVREAKYGVLLVNDSDISVPRDYLARVVRPLADPEVGLVTCLYRAASSSMAGKWEALGIATDFIPSTLVAPFVGIKEFGLGSTLCFRRDDLGRVGGFEAIGDYIADDYQLAKRITGLGKRAHLSEVVVETHLSDPDWGAVWRHQLRWARTIRVSRGDGFLGLPVTHAGLWALLCLLGGLPVWAAALWAARMATAIAGGWFVLRYRPSLLFAPITPVWDVWAFVVWIAGLTGSTVEWRGGKMRLSEDGRITS